MKATTQYIIRSTTKSAAAMFPVLDESLKLVAWTSRKNATRYDRAAACTAAAAFEVFLRERGSSQDLVEVVPAAGGMPINRERK